MRRSCEPGIRYPRKRPESNHLLTVRGATLHIFATWPVVNTFFITRTPLAFDWCETSEVSSPLRLDPSRRGARPPPVVAGDGSPTRATPAIAPWSCRSFPDGAADPGGTPHCDGLRVGGPDKR